MDRVIPKKRWSKKRLLTIGGIAAILLLIIASYYYTSGGSKLNVDTERITISDVTKGPFQESIVENGSVLPLHIIYLDAQEGGRVEEKFVDDGTIMKDGQPIIRLSNADLQLQMIGQQTAVYNLLAQMEIAQNAAQQNMINNENTLTDAQNNLKEATRIYNLDQHLYAEKAIGSQEYQAALNAYTYQLQKQKLMMQSMAQDSLTNAEQLKEAHQSYQASSQSLELLREEVGDLIVKAPADGLLTSLDAEVGESKNKGDHLGEIDEQDGFKVRVDVDELYIDRIYDGLKGSFVFSDSTFTMKITKVYPHIAEGRFQVDMEFIGRAPSGIRRGQTLQVLLALSDPKQAILVPRGGFFEQTGGNWIFKVSADGRSAYRVNIQLGSQNPDYYEVLQGLKPGDQVITSSYENYGTIQQLVLKK